MGFRVIGCFKILGAVLLALAGFGVLRLVHGDVAEGLERLASAIRLDPENRAIHGAIATVSGVSPGRLRAIGVGTFAYAALYGVEGVGLALGLRWAGYLTVIATGSLIPVELYEIAAKPGPVKVLVLVINAAILVYLIWALRREGRAAAPAGA